MDAIVFRGQKDDPAAGTFLEQMLSAAPRVRLLAIQGLARSRTPPIHFDSDADYERWYEQVVVPEGLKIKKKETSR